MRRWLRVCPVLFVACGSGSPADSLPADSLTAMPRDIAVACEKPDLATSSSFCFAGVDYSHFPPGAIYEVGADGSVSTLFQRASGSLTSYAQAPDGTVYFTNAVNGMALYKIVGSGEAVVYQHDTYVRMVRVDSRGQVSFNESSGAGADGRIYKLVNGAAKVFYEVKLSTVHGFWGDFGFDSEDRLWLSSSNEIPSRLYLVVDGTPKVVYMSEHTSFMGFRFLDTAKVLFAGQDRTLGLLDLCSLSVKDVFTVPGNLQAQDVNACPKF